MFAVTALLLVLFVHSPFGLSLRGVRSNEARLAALGYRTGLHRYLAWVIAVFFAGVAGVLYVFVNSLISPTTMAFSADGFLVVMVVLGGLGSIWGPALGAMVIVLFQQELSTYVTRWQTLMGLTLIAVVLFSPGGFWGLVRAAGRRRDALIARLQAGRPAGPAGRAGRRARAGAAGRRSPWRRPSRAPSHGRRHDRAAQPPQAGRRGRPGRAPALVADHLCRRFRGVTAVADVSLRIPAGRPLRHHRPERGRQDHPVQPAVRRAAAVPPAAWPCSGRTSPRCGRTGGPRWASGRTFQITRVFGDLTVLENLTLALHGLSRTKLSLLRPWRRYRDMIAEAAELAASFGLAERLGTPRRPSCPTARYANWRCCSPSRSSRGCCCSTSPRPGSRRPSAWTS